MFFQREIKKTCIFQLWINLQFCKMSKIIVHPFSWTCDFSAVKFKEHVIAEQIPRGSTTLHLDQVISSRYPLRTELPSDDSISLSFSARIFNCTVSRQVKRDCVAEHRSLQCWILLDELSNADIDTLLDHVFARAQWNALLLWRSIPNLEGVTATFTSAIMPRKKARTSHYP